MEGKSREAKRRLINEDQVQHGGLASRGIGLMSGGSSDSLIGCFQVYVKAKYG